MNELLRTESISKSFPGVKALSDVSLRLLEGEILALCGENGAGKSTLMKILAGVQPPDTGKILVSGREVQIHNPIQAKKLGIGIVFQELSLANNLSVAENIFALSEPTKFGLIDFRSMRQQTKELLDRLGFDIDPLALVGDLSVSQQQLVEIAKVLRNEPKILILDEPTSALSEREVEKLFTVLEQLRDRGTGVVYISHKMDEIFRIADNVSVLRDGVHVGDAKVSETSPDELVTMMVGRSLESAYPDRTPVPDDSRLVLELVGFTRRGKYEDISLDVGSGEILGIYGLVGAGRTELAQGVFGILPAESGVMKLEGKQVRISSPFAAVASGIGYATEDRKQQGLVLEAPVTHNTTMANLREISNAFRFIQIGKEKTIARAAIDAFHIKTPSLYQELRNLSGGNQQKVVLAKWLETNPRLLILDEPTRGIDVGAKYEIYVLMQELAKRGVAIIMISSELPEIMSVSHRVLVMNDHRIIAEVDPTVHTAEDIMHHITGGKR